MSRTLPILFNTDMVKAILEGRKTVTRRVLKQPFEVHPNGYITKPRGNENLCPYEPPYKVGDILYVRETWCDDRIFTKGDTPGIYFYKASAASDFTPKWKPSIHMPKEAARIFLKVKDVRVERLQDMKFKDYTAEGIKDMCDFCSFTYDKCDTCAKDATMALSFIGLWDSTIKKDQLKLYGWKANPYVWVIEFERCEEKDK